MTGVILPKARRTGPEARATRLIPGVIALLTLAGTAWGAGEPSVPRFPLSDRGPFSAILGIPDGWTELAGPPAELSWHVANHAIAQESPEEILILDGETQTVTLRLQHRFAPRLSVGVEVPWIAHSGGFLDPIIDDWHDAFGFSGGIRPSVPTGDLRFIYARDEEELFNLDQRASGLGDVRTSAALCLAGGVNDAGRLLIELSADVEWPTGDARRLTGSGGTDLAAGIRVARPVVRPLAPGARLGWAISAGLAWPGDVDLPLPPASAQIPYYDAALAWAATPALDLVLQAQGHGGSYQSDLPALGAAALQLGGGVIWQFSRHYAIRFGIFEDIRTDTTPDFAAELALIFRRAN
jgi:hypothetical protein